MYFITFMINSQNLLKKSLQIDHGAAFFRKRPLIKKYYLTPYFCGLYSRAACNRERLLMARLRYLQFRGDASPINARISKQLRML